ncbi:hypothetical protein A3K86_03085 [Photobacterium jeanii]|uniref:DUF302 domain-containing protein n=1 Tax=Photobacterium jeanii TaxID=858640 RepID=A0A178KLB4_9GAMM|nr:DUF302 domain-containing protein [Photobacterium jeanii]OAN17916.1 hypothetical protein A3K86_03085 [Photobacterium jeanii]PST92415.1 DUF302 domain-containing protein [Photobacterium jeanii]
MKRYLFGFICAAALTTTSTLAQDGLVRVKSHFDVETTANQFEQVIVQSGMTVFSRVRHSESASKIGVSLPPTQLIIFGNPKVGSKLMTCQQSIAIDLPQKALVSQDNSNTVWLTYNDPEYLAKRHKIKGCDAVIGKVKKALASFAEQATQAP